MKKLLIACALLLSLQASADSFKFRLFESTVGKFTTFVLEITMDGEFRAGSKITQVTLLDTFTGKPVPLFAWDHDGVAQSFAYSWKSASTLSLKTKNDYTGFKSVVTQATSNHGWGDARIHPADDYTAEIDGEILLTENGSDSESTLTIANQSQEAGALWGQLKK